MAQDPVIVGPALEPLPEKVLSLGDLVSLTFKRFRLYYKLYFRALLAPSIVCALASQACFFGFDHWVSIASHSLLAWAPFVAHMMLVVFSLLIWVFAAWELSLRCCALVRLVLCLDVDYKSAYAALKKRTGAVFAACNLAVAPPTICIVIWTFVAFLALSSLTVIPAAVKVAAGAITFGVIGFGLTVSVTLSSLFGSLLLAIVTCEELSLKQSVARAWQFMRLRLYRGGSFTCLLGMAIVLIYVGASIPALIAESFESGKHVAGEANLTLLSSLVEIVMDIPLNIFIFSISFTGYGLFYRDLTLRLEGRDLLARLARFS